MIPSEQCGPRSPTSESITPFLQILQEQTGLQVLLFFLAVITALGSFIYLAVDSIVTDTLYEQHTLRGVSIASNLAANTADFLLVDDVSQLQLLLKNTQQSERETVYIFILDAKGQVPAHTFPGGFPGDLRKLPQRFDNQPFSTQLIETEQGILLDVSVPVLQGSLGSVHIGLSRQFIDQKLNAIRHRIFFLCILAGIAAIALAVFFSRRITRPLTALAEGAENIGRGNLGYRIKSTKNDELGIVSRAFDQMAVALEEDIAQRLQAEKDLLESEALYRSLVENIDKGITLIDQDHTIVMANAAQEKIFTKDLSEFVRRKCFREFGKSDAICSHCPGVTAMADGTPKEIIHDGKRADGSLITVKIKAFPVVAEDGRNKGFIEVVEDITQQQKAEHDLAAEKERLAVTLRSIGDGAITTDISGKIVLLNKVAEKLTGWSLKEAKGMPVEEVFHIVNGQTLEKWENPVSRAINTGKVVELARNTILIARDGVRKNIADSGAPIRDFESKIIGVVLVFRDVTEEMKTEKELLKIKKLESVGVLAGGIAHDFNNILAAILGNIDLALLGTGLDDKTKELLQKAVKGTLRAKDLTQQLLTFSKGGEPVKETSSLESIITDSANFVLRGGNVSCNYDIPDDLWLVDIDKSQMSQVVQNIVLNASHAMPEGGEIRITCENVSSVDASVIPFVGMGRIVKIIIQDCGIGMPENVLEKVFGPYFTTKQEGSGLGLAITQSIITKHQGYMSVESSPGIGSIFTLYLPASDKTETTTHRPDTLSTESPSFGARILVMDDDEMVQDVSKEMLTQLGHEVVIAQDGKEAIRLYQESRDTGNPFGLIIMDLTVPGGMGGKEAVREILNMDPDARVIVSSGYSSDPIMSNFKDYGFCAAIVKPYQFEDLSRVISQVLA